jgi:hypothetical protein
MLRGEGRTPWFRAAAVREISGWPSRGGDMPSLQLLQLTDRGRGLLASRRFAPIAHKVCSLFFLAIFFPIASWKCIVCLLTVSRAEPGGLSLLFLARWLLVELWPMLGQTRAGGGGVRRQIMAAKPVNWLPMGMGGVKMVDWLQQSRKRVGLNLCIS